MWGENVVPIMICQLLSFMEQFSSFATFPALPLSIRHPFKCQRTPACCMALPLGQRLCFSSKTNNNETGPWRRFVIFLPFFPFSQITTFLFIPPHIKTLLQASQGVLPSLIFTWIVILFQFYVMIFATKIFLFKRLGNLLLYVTRKMKSPTLLLNKECLCVGLMFWFGFCLSNFQRSFQFLVFLGFFFFQFSMSKIKS